MNRYPKYKDSGIEWLGEIPEHWAVKRLKHNISAITGNAFDSDDYKENGIPLIRIGDVSTNGIIDVDNTKKLPNEFLDTYHSYIVENGDILMAMTGATIGKVGKYNYDNPALLNQRVIKFKATSMNQHFLWFIVNSNNYLVYIKLTGFGGAQANISDKQLLDFPATNPPIEEQQAIASYLDRETERIDLLIKKKERMIELLKEKRIAMISNAVTKGLNRDVRKKDSGIEWLGEVPEHCEVKRLKNVATVNDEALSEKADPNLDIVYVDIGGVSLDEGIIHTEEFKFEDAPSRARRIVRKGDIIVSTVRTYLMAIAAIKDNIENFIVSTGFAVIRPKVIHPDFLAFLMKTQFIIESIVSRSVGVSYPAVNSCVIARLKIPLPPINEQEQIASYLDRETKQIDKLSEKIRDSITLLREYRSALITAAVTGKIDVRDEESLELRVEG